MYNKNHRTERLLLITRRVESKKPALTKKEERIQYYTSIVGTATATLLAIVSIILTIIISKNATKVDKMDQLLSLMVEQNQRQGMQIDELRELQKSSFELSGKLSDQITTIRNQTAFLQNTYSPDISLNAITFSKSNMKEGQNVLQYEFTNIGGRRLQNLHSRIFLFLV